MSMQDSVVSFDMIFHRTVDLPEAGHADADAHGRIIDVAGRHELPLPDVFEGKGEFQRAANRHRVDGAVVVALDRDRRGELEVSVLTPAVIRPDLELNVGQVRLKDASAQGLGFECEEILLENEEIAFCMTHPAHREPVFCADYRVVHCQECAQSDTYVYGASLESGKPGPLLEALVTGAWSGTTARSMAA